MLKYAGWIVGVGLVAYIILRPQKTLIVTEYKDRIVVHTVTQTVTSGVIIGGTTVVDGNTVVNYGGRVDFTSSRFQDSKVQRDTESKTTTAPAYGPSVLVGPSVWYAEHPYLGFDLGIRIYHDLYVRAGVATKRLTGIDAGQAGLLLAF